MKYKAIIFDMDGTIIDTDHIWRQARHDMFQARGIPLSPELDAELERLCHGIALKQSCKTIKELGNIPDSVEHLIQEKSKRACDLYAISVRFIDGFLEFYDQTVQHNLKVSIATNADDQTVLVTDQRLNLRKLFGKHIYNISHVNFVGKPDPAIYRHAAEQLGVSPQDCIAIEDSAGGIKAATGAGMFCIGINTAKKPDLLKESHMIIQGYRDINLAQLLAIQTAVAV